MTDKKQAAPLILPKKNLKSERLQLVVYPEVLQALREQKEMTGRSINDICNIILKQALGV